MSSPHTMISPRPVAVREPVATGPTRHGNPNPRAPHQKINPPASANHPSQKPTSSGQPPRSSVGRQERSLPLTGQYREGDRKKRLAEEDASRATKKPKIHHDTATPAGVPEKEKEKEKNPNYQLNGSKPAATTAPQVAKNLLTLTDKLLKGARKEALTRKAGKAVAKPSTTDGVKAAPAANLPKEKRRLSEPDELEPVAKKARPTSEATKPSYTDQVKGKSVAASSSNQEAKPAHRSPDYNADTIAVSATSQVEKPLRFMTEREKREQRRAVRQYLFALEAIKAPDETQDQGVAPAPAATKQKKDATKQKKVATKHEKVATKDKEEDQSPSRGTNRQIDRSSKQAGARAENKKQLTAAKEVINGKKKHRPDNEVAKQPNGNPKVGHAGLKSQTREKLAPPRRTDQSRGKSPAIGPDSESDSDSDSDSEVEEELSEKEKKQRAFAAYREKRLALQAARAAKSSPPAASPPDSSNSPPSQSTTTETREPSPPTPVLDSITFLSPPSPSGSDPRSRSNSSETLRQSSSSGDSGNNNNQSKGKKLTRSEIRRKFIKD